MKLNKFAVVITLILLAVGLSQQPSEAIHDAEVYCGADPCRYPIGAGVASGGSVTNNDTASQNVRLAIDYVHLRFPWAEIENGKDGWRWSRADGTGFDDQINRVLSDTVSGAVVVGITPKWSGQPSWTPAYIIDPTSIYAPIVYTPTGEYMVNYADPDVQTRWKEVVSQVITHTKQTWGHNVILVAMMGVDGEAQPEYSAAGFDRKQAYKEAWGSTAQTTWETYVKTMLAWWDAQAAGQERLYGATAAFISSYERNTIIRYLLTLANADEWGFYVMHLNPDYNFTNYIVGTHDTPDLLRLTDNSFGRNCNDVNYAEQTDAWRCLGRTHAIYSEYSKSTNQPSTSWSGYSSEWFIYWGMLSCAWQRIDGCGALRSWIEIQPQTGVMQSWYAALRDWWGTGNNPMAGRKADNVEGWVAMHRGFTMYPDPVTQLSKNYFQFIDQIDTAAPADIGDTCSGVTQPVWYIPQDTIAQTPGYKAIIESGGALTVAKESAFSRRMDNCMYITFDPLQEGWWNPVTHDEDLWIDVNYLDAGFDTFSIQTWSGAAMSTRLTISKTNSLTWKWASDSNGGTWLKIPAGSASYGTKEILSTGSGYYLDLRLNANLVGGLGADYIHMVKVRKLAQDAPTPTPTPGYQTSTPTRTPTLTPTRTPTWTPGGVTATPTPTPTATPTPTPRPTSIWFGTYYLGADTDDAYNNEVGMADCTGWSTTHSAKMGGISGSNDYETGFRFTGITRPNSTALVQTANLVWVAHDTNTENITLRIYVQKSATAPTFTNCAGGYYPGAATRPRTTAYTEYIPEAWAADNTYRSADFSTALQEVIDAYPAWDGSIAIIIIGQSATGFRVPWWRDPWDGNANLATQLEIAWYTPTEPTATPTWTATPMPETPTPFVTALPTGVTLLVSYPANVVSPGNEVLLRFPAPPAGTIVTATLYVSITAYSGIPTLITFLPLQSGWSGGYSTWTAYFHSIEPPLPWAYWDEPGATGVLDVESDPYAAADVSATGWLEVGITQISRRWQTANSGILLRLVDVIEGDSVTIASAYSATPPYITYYTHP